MFVRWKSQETDNASRSADESTTAERQLTPTVGRKANWKASLIILTFHINTGGIFRGEVTVICTKLGFREQKPKMEPL